MANNQPRKPRGNRREIRLFKTRRKKPNFILSVLVQAVAILLVVVLVIGVSGVGVVLGIAKAYYDTTPDLDIDQIEQQDLTSFIYDMNGDLITDYKGSENRIWASFDEIPEMLYMAFVSVEDARFFTHNGIDIKRIVGAFVSNLRNESVQGGSTITQQLIKTRLLSLEQTYKRKLQEAYMAVELESKYSKEQILEWYLNTIPLGNSNYGIKAAAMDYFGKDLSELSLRECAALAGVTRNPTRYNPRRNYYGAGKPENTIDRTNYVLRTMYENGAITREEYSQALVDELHVVEESHVSDLYDMPDAVEAVIYDATAALLELRGLEDTAQNRRIIRSEMQTGGYSIYSTIDPKIQAIAEDTIYNWEHYPDLKDNSKAITRERTSDGTIIELMQPQAAATIYDYRSGEIRAIVGSRTPPSQMLQLNRARTSQMPVGSSIKPLSVYGPALDLGASPASVARNLPLPIEGWGTEKGYPSNFSSGSYRGVVTLRQGMKASLNIVAANTLLQYVGVQQSAEYLRKLGVHDPAVINEDGSGLALGSSGIPVMQMATAFGTVANKGQYQRPLTVTKIVDGKGVTVLDLKQVQALDTRQAFKPGTAWMLTDMLTEAVQSGTGTSAKIEGITVAGKTGTHSEYRSVFFAGYTGHYSAAVWIGHDEFYALANSTTGGKAAAPLWKAIMEKVYTELGLENRAIIEDSPESLGLVQGTVCSLSGKLATESCMADEAFKPVTDWFHQGTVPTATCDMHGAEALCLDSGYLATPYCPNQSTAGVQLIPEEWGVGALSEDVFRKLFPGGTIVSAQTQWGDQETTAAYCPFHSFGWGDDDLNGGGMHWWDQLETGRPGPPEEGSG